jgi:hypothetical protein
MRLRHIPTVAIVFALGIATASAAAAATRAPLQPSCPTPISSRSPNSLNRLPLIRWQTQPSNRTPTTNPP